MCVSVDAVARLDVIISDEVEKELREVIAREMGLKKGNISVAVEEAIKMWIASKKKGAKR